MFEGQIIYLGEGYSLKLIEISALRGNALFHILNKEDYVFNLLNSNAQDISFPSYKKTMDSGQIWQIADNYSLTFKASSTDRIAWLEFMINNKPVDINTTNITAGDHKIYIHAMERNNRWGEFYQVNFTVIQNGFSAESTPRLAQPGIIYGLISIILSYLFIRKWR